MGMTWILTENPNLWRGTVMAVFQPSEEAGQGTRAMIEDGQAVSKPDVTPAQHVTPLSAEQIGWRTVTMLSAGDSWKVTLLAAGRTVQCRNVGNTATVTTLESNACDSLWVAHFNLLRQPVVKLADQHSRHNQLVRRNMICPDISRSHEPCDRMREVRERKQHFLHNSASSPHKFAL